MIAAWRLAWLQLTLQRLRLGVAIAGVAFAVILIMMQLGFQDALFSSAVTVHSRLNAEIVIVHPQSTYLASMKEFSRRRLYQAASFEGVESVTPVLTKIGNWKNPHSGAARGIFVVGIDPSSDAFAMPELEPFMARIRYPDRVVYDRASRPEFGPIAALVDERGTIAAEVNQRELEVVGLYQLGTSFGIDGSVITSDQNFRRLFPNNPPGLIHIGLVRLEEGADVETVRSNIEARLPDDVDVLTLPQYMDREVDYWASATPIGYVFKFGVVMGLVVGSIIVYQILFADISDHLAEYATLKAMGYPNSYLSRVVLMEALILALAGFGPGVLVSSQLYRAARSATMLPMQLSLETSGTVLGLTVLMCWVSALIAVRKVRSADPAEIF